MEIIEKYSRKILISLLSDSMIIQKLSEKYMATIDDVEYLVTVPCDLDNMIVQLNYNCAVIPKKSEIWNRIYKELDIR